MKTIQILLTVSMGKRLIARGLMADPEVQKAMTSGRILILTGTTDAYVAEEALRMTGSDIDFDRRSFRRGITTTPGAKTTVDAKEADLLIDHGKAYLDRTVYDIAPELEAGDIIFKGANALYLPEREAGVLIANPQGGTFMPILSAVVGRRVRLVVPVGLEKRVEKPISELAEIANASCEEGLRLCPMPGRVFTELDAIRILTGAQATLLAAGGTLGAEGAVYLAVTGEEEQIEQVRSLMKELSSEPPTVL